MDIKRSGAQPSVRGPADYFTGVVRIDAPFSGSGKLSGATVTFEPGARTAWHTHPLGQTLLVTSGLGRVQREGGMVEEIRPGDIIWFAPDEKHWHGAAPDCAMTHIAIAEMKDGSVVTWLEKVSDAQFTTPPLPSATGNRSTSQGESE
ncbi:cupin domain-containing protein [Sphingomonas bacterium]|uniref:(R)-mandelonitrile lyase n=1 Tax=Sphingomonas bacterium TaxID=1895847 RepID=UPI0015765993|nr:cupin domain-containing protein [Sphingomonas bacterium]